MKLFHGTSLERWHNNIKDAGIVPRSTTGGNWDNVVPSNEAFTYFTHSIAAAAFHGYRTHVIDRSDISAIIAIDLSKIDEKNLRADEEFIHRRDFGGRRPTFADWQQCVTKIADETQWQESLSETRTASHKGVIPPEALSLHMLLPIKKNPFYVPEVEAVNEFEFDLLKRKHAHSFWLECFNNLDHKKWKKVNSGPVTRFGTIRKRIEKFDKETS